MTRTENIVTTKRIHAGHYSVIVNGENIGCVTSWKSLGYAQNGWYFSPNDCQGQSFDGDTKASILNTFR